MRQIHLRDAHRCGEKAGCTLMAIHSKEERSPREPRVLAEEISHSASVECLRCGSEWQSGHAFVEECLQQLRAELQEPESEMPARYALTHLSATAQRLLRDNGFELITTCSGCHLERAHQQSTEWMHIHSPRTEL